MEFATTGLLFLSGSDDSWTACPDLVGASRLQEFFYKEPKDTLHQVPGCGLENHCVSH